MLDGSLTLLDVLPLALLTPLGELGDHLLNLLDYHLFIGLVGATAFAKMVSDVLDAMVGCREEWLFLQSYDSGVAFHVLLGEDEVFGCWWVSKVRFRFGIVILFGCRKTA